MSVIIKKKKIKGGKMEKKREIIEIIANALNGSGKVRYTVKIFNGSALQIQTEDKRHYNILIRDIDRLKGHIVDLKQKKGKPHF